jgi:hypothetical protein
VAAGTVFTETTRAPRYLVSRSMTSMAISSAMANTVNASGIGDLLSPGRTAPEQPGEKCLRHTAIGHVDNSTVGLGRRLRLGPSERVIESERLTGDPIP